jgi:hypothetical protein
MNAKLSKIPWRVWVHLNMNFKASQNSYFKRFLKNRNKLSPWPISWEAMAVAPGAARTASYHGCL